MSEKKSELIKKIAKVGITAGLCLLPVVSNGQNLKEDINWTKIKEPYGKYTLTIRSINPLPELSKYKSNPTKYLPHGNLNLGYNNTYTVPQDSIKGNVSKYLKLIDVCPDCTKPKRTISTKKVSTKKTPTPTKPIQLQKTVVPQPNKLERKVETSDTLRKEVQKEEQGINYNVNETNTTNNITNYYIAPQEVKAASDTAAKKSKEEYLRFRTLIDAGKGVNPLNSPFWNFSINPQIGKNSFWIGPYATFGFGNKRDSVLTDIYEKTLLNQALQLFTETQGVRKGYSKLRRPFEFGGTLSLNTKDNRVRFDLSYGLVNEINSTSDVVESGFDRIIQNEIVTQEKPYEFTKEKGNTYKSWNQIQKVGIAVQPFKKGGFYLGTEAEHIGKINSKAIKNETVNFNVKAGWRFGGNKK